MTIIRSGLMALILILPFSGALAQSAGPEIKADSKHEAQEIRDGAADVGKSGSTGQTKAPGSNSGRQAPPSDTRTTPTRDGNAK